MTTAVGGQAQTIYGSGAPVATAPNGSRYFNTDQAPYAEYVSVNGVWVSVSPASLILANCTVAQLPVAAVANAGWRGTVTNSNAALTAGIGAVAAGGGANVVPVFSDGVNWRIG